MRRRKRTAKRLGSDRPQDATSPEERRRFLDSADLERAVTAHFERAAKLAVADHHRAGLPVHGTVDGRLDGVPPPARRVKLP